MNLVPPTDTPKPRLRALVKAVLVGGCLGAAYGAVAGYFTDDHELVIYAAIGGAFAGFLIWTLPLKVLWGRRL